ncbi:ABC-transporter [Propionibacterium freudenreichii]|uniref:ABC transporter ATP-binding protein n=1 Tax=Propionibacterium freudenreichii TaxID=1744 RepID=UPI000543DA8C|nr:ABC transporter ATP-binding protein [Propionibacterium freudenreichii]CEH02568.1 ABC-transporter [Propionibacterium freudenreichii]
MRAHGPVWLPRGPANRWLPLASGRQIAAQVRSHSHGLWRWLVLAVVAMTISALTSLALPVATGMVVDQVRTHGPLSGLIAPGVMVVTAVIIGAVASGAGQALTPSYFAAVLARLREDMLARALDLDQQLIEQAGSADLVARVGDDVATVRDSVNAGLPRMVNTSILLVVAASGLAAMSPLFLLPLAAGAVVFTASVRWFLKRAPAIYRNERQASARQSQDILSTLHGLDAVRAFGLAGLRTGIVARSSWQAVRWELRGRFLSNALVLRLVIGEAVVIIGQLLVSYPLVTGGHVSVGQASAAGLLLLSLMGPLRFLLMFIDDLQAAYASLQRIVGVLGVDAHHAPQGDDSFAAPTDGAGAGQPGAGSPAGARSGVGPSDTGPVESRPVGVGPMDTGAMEAGPIEAARIEAGRIEAGPMETGRIEIRHLGFAYRPDQPVLSDINLTIAPGEHVAVIGESGAGKSTLAKLISGTLSSSSGEVAVGARPGTRGPAVVLVSQDIHTFSGSLADDVTMGAPASTADDQLAALARDALDRVGADWATDLSMVVGRLGTALSPAQAQQVALARVLVADPAIVILDEATAEAGSAGARMLDRAADQAIAGRTALVIAHRLSQAAHADRIVVMARDRIAEVGTPDELLARDGEFTRLWRAWQAER